MTNNIKTELKQSYIDTTYSVFVENTQYDIKIGKTLPSAITKLLGNENTAAIITAWNPRSQAISLTENKSRNEVLYSKIKKFTVYKAIGEGSDPSWPAEDSYFILGINLKEIEQLAVEFEQNAYVWLETTKNAELAFSNIWRNY